MIKESALPRRATALIAAAALVVAAIVPVLGAQYASAAQVTSRSIRVTSSKVSQSGVTYNVSFKPSTVTGSGTDDILGIVIDFCQNSPLIGTTCTKTNGVSAVPTSGTVNVTHNGTSNLAFTVNDPTGTTNDGNQLVLTHATGLTSIASSGAGSDLTFSFTATNPSGTSSTAGAPGTFYARVLTYNTGAGATSYTDSTPGTHLDDGGVALSTARQLTVNARVQEQLEFCVAAIDGTIDTAAEVPANCAAFPTTTAVDIGVVDSNAPSVSPVSASNGGNEKNGGVMIRTNAVGGAVISYFAEQESSSGKLKVTGASCSGTSTTDQCFNSASTPLTDFTTLGEKFGMSIGQVLRPTTGTTTNLTEDNDYNGTGLAAGGFTWADSGNNNPATTIASSSTVLDYEMLVLNFAARAAATTPTGSYAVTSTYIATSTF